jgi:chorismate mutase
VTVSPELDAIMRRYRDEIAELDRRLVETVNARIRAVEELHRYKADHDLPMRDAAREQWLVEHLQETNAGPLTSDGVAELVRFVLDLVRREQGRG